MTKITDAQATMLTAAAQRDDGLLAVGKLNGAARVNTARGLLAKGLVEVVEGLNVMDKMDGVVWGTDDTGAYGYRLTAAAFDALSIDPSERPAYLAREAVEPVGTFIRTTTIEAPPVSLADLAERTHPAGAANAESWDGHLGSMTRKVALANAAEAAGITGGTKASPAPKGRKGAPIKLVPAAVPGAGAGLGAALAAITAPKGSKAPKAARAASAPDGAPSAKVWPRPGSKIATMVTMLKSDAGATAQQVADALGWKVQNATSVIIGLKTRRGFTVVSEGKATERVYRITAEPAAAA